MGTFLARLDLDTLAMTLKPLLLCLALAPAPLLAQTFYKCVEGGVTTYAERPCGKSSVAIGKPAAPLAAPAAAPPVAGGMPAAAAAPSQQASRDAQLATMARERRIRTLEFEIRDAERELENELYALRAKKDYARNNLAGATWEGSISQEMQAVTARWNARIEVLRRDLSEQRASR
jgi:hypothetical protein